MQEDARGDKGQDAGDRLSRLSEATLRINENLDFPRVLQSVVDSACELTGARYGALNVLDGEYPYGEYFSHGLTPAAHQQLADLPGGKALFDYFSQLKGPLRIPDFDESMASLGLPPFRPVTAGPFVAVPIRRRDEHLGTIYLARERGASEFVREDEEVLTLFATQALLVIANARKYRDEERARASLETLIDTSPVGVVVLDVRTGSPVSFNREALRIVERLQPGGTPEQFLQALTFRRGDGPEVSMAEIPLTQVIRAAETWRAEEVVLQVPEGPLMRVLVNAAPVYSDQERGEVESVIVAIQDMTPLEEQARLRAEFLAMVSHELRAPLTSIKGSASTLRESMRTLDPAEAVQFAGIIESQANRMRDLIGELLDVAHIETGSLSVTLEPVDVGSLVDEARSAFPGGHEGASVVIDVESGLPFVMADRRRVVQVLGNLLANAARHSDVDAPIALSAAREGGYVRFSVADSGQGVPSERLPLLFQKFVHASTEDGEPQGSGLGLAICKGIVEAHGGRIWAESDGPGLGARFAFTVPAAPEGGGRTVRDAALAPPPPSREADIRILAVDDDPHALRYARQTLEKAGYVPVVTGEAREVLDLVASERPSLVLLDLVLPGTDGIELMQRIHSSVHVPVIFVSAYGRDETIARALQLGAVDYVVKPFSPTELVARVEAALRKRAAPDDDAPEPFVLGDLSIDYAAHQVSLAGRPVNLTPTEYRLLFELSIQAGRVLTFEQILDGVWGWGHSTDKSAVRTTVKRLRRKLGDSARDPVYLFAQPRVGYRLGSVDDA